MPSIVQVRPTTAPGRHQPAPRTAAATTRCRHLPACPSADRSDRDAARILVCHPEQGWSLLCNGVVLFDDAGQLLPDGRIAPRPATVGRQRPTATGGGRHAPGARPQARQTGGPRDPGLPVPSGRALAF
jgi:hypothetical protein